MDQCKSIAPEIRKSRRCGSAPTATTTSSPEDTVIYRSRLNAKINRNFEVFAPTDFLAAITQHIPDKGAQMVRYYGWYSNKMRGLRQRGLPSELVVRRPGLSRHRR